MELQLNGRPRVMGDSEFQYTLQTITSDQIFNSVISNPKGTLQILPQDVESMKYMFPTVTYSVSWYLQFLIIVWGDVTLNQILCDYTAA